MSRRPPEPALDAPVDEVVAWLRNMQTGTPVTWRMRKRVFGLTKHFNIQIVDEYTVAFGTHPFMLARWIEEHVTEQVTHALAPAPDTH